MVNLASGAAERVPSAELDRLGDEIAELSAHLHAATYRLLERLREFDVREGWSGGFRSCAHWLSWRTGIGPGAAREKVRVARALEGLPQISAAFERGRLSYAKVRALSRVATAETEAELLEFGLMATAAQVERLVRAWRRADRAEETAQERARHEARALTLYIDDDGSYVIRGHLDPEVGAVLQRALNVAAEALRAADDGRDDAAQRRADALGLVAELALAHAESCAAQVESCAEHTQPSAARDAAPQDPAPQDAAPPDAAPQDPAPVPAPDRDHTDVRNHDHDHDHDRKSTIRRLRRADRFQVVVHVDAAALRADSASGQSALEDGVRVPAETARRLACDASRVVMTHAADGTTVGTSRRTRTVPPSVRRALEHRDRGCRFPGCDNRICDAHHIRHWADGGATMLSNLVLLCRRCHRRVHEDGYHIRMVQNAGIVVLRPDGSELPHAPALQPPGDGLAEQLRDAAHHHGIDAASTLPHWTSRRLDLDFALRTLHR